MRKLLAAAAVCALVLGVYVISNRALAQDPAVPQKAVAVEKGSTEEKKIDPAFETDIRRLLELTGQKHQGRQAMQLMIAQFKKTMPQVPVEFWGKFMKKVDMNELIDMVVPIYARHLTHEDVKGLIVFYQTPLGQKLLKAQPAIMQESMQAGMAWGRKISQQVVQELKAEQERGPGF